MNEFWAFIGFGSLWLIAVGVHRDLCEASRLREMDAQRDVSREAKFISAVIGRLFSTLSSEERAQVRVLESHRVLFRKRGKIRLRRKYVRAWQHAVEIREMVERDKTAWRAQWEEQHRNDLKPAPEVP